jgi:hypothetical protein
MNTRSGLSFRPKACLRCGGDAYLNRSEDAEWVCLQCGRTVPEAIDLVRLPEGRLEREPMSVAADRRAA